MVEGNLGIGSDTDISLQIKMFSKEAIGRVYKQKMGHFILGIL